MSERIKVMNMEIEIMITKIKLTLIKCKKYRLYMKLLYKCSNIFGKYSMLYITNRISSEEFYNGIQTICKLIENVRES